MTLIDAASSVLGQRGCAADGSLLHANNLRMRTYNWHNRRLTEGLSIRISSQGNAYVPLGEPKSPGPSHMVTLHRDNPPKIRSNQIRDAFPYWVRPRKGDPFLVLAKPHEHHADDKTVLLRVSTWSPKTFGGRGFWRMTEGETPTLLTGIQYYTDQNGREAIASEGLVTLDPGQTLRIRPEGSDDQWAVTNTGDEVVSEPWDFYRMRLVLEGDSRHPERVDRFEIDV